MQTQAQPRRLTTAETAKLVRATLKRTFPLQKFNVRSKVYSGGSSIDVTWVDGPTVAEVDQAVKRFEGATFDGMTDYKGYKAPVRVGGELLQMGTDWVQCQRTESAALLRECAEAIAQKYGCAAPVVQVSSYTHGGKVHESAWYAANYTIIDPFDAYHKTANDKAMQLAQRTSKYPQ